MQSSGNSINSVEAQLVEDYVKGSRGTHGELSSIRRCFCLYVTFDFLFTTLLWLICIVLSGHKVIATLEDEVVKYSVYLSLFDIVMVAFIRSLLLVLIYAFLHLNHWWAVALTTAGSSGFLIAKVFLFEWDRYSNSTFTVLLLLSSFALAWGEAWFLDFRVFPREMKAKLIEENLLNGERDPLINRSRLSPNLYTEEKDDIRQFYSPFQSPAGSDDENDNESEITSSHQLDPQEMNYKRQGHEVLEMVWRILQSSGWRLEKSSPTGDTVYCQQHPKIGKIYRLSGVLDINPRIIFDELFYNVGNVPNWNPTVLFSKVIQKIDRYTDICYQVAAEGGKGIIASRDFVCLRHWEMKGDVIISAGISVEHHALPPLKEYVRGQNGPGALVLKPYKKNPNRCHFCMLLNTDLKGWLPQYLIDQVLSTVMMDYIQHLRQYANDLKGHRGSEVNSNG